MPMSEAVCVDQASSMHEYLAPGDMAEISNQAAEPGFILDYRTANLHYCKLFFLVCHAAKTMRTGGKKVCFRIAECSLFFMRKVLLKQERGRFAY